MGMKAGLALATAVATIALCAPALAAPTAITEFPVQPGSPAGAHKPMYIQPSPDGTLWFSDLGAAKGLGQITTAGTVLRQATPGQAATGDLGFDEGGTLFWAAGSATQGGFYMLPPGGTQTGLFTNNLDAPYAVGFRASVAGGSPPARFTALYRPTNKYRVCIAYNLDCSSQTETATRMTDLTLDARGRLWALQPEGPVARRMNADATAFDLAITLPAGSTPGRAALGPDGNLWVAGFGNAYTSANTANRIVRLSPDGGQTSFLLPPGRGPNDIAMGPDGALWFTEFLSGSIGRITTAGAYTSFPVPSAASVPRPYGIAKGADGSLWFTELDGGRIGRLVPGSDAATGATPLTAVKDTIRPSLGAIGLSRTRFRAAGSGASISAKKKKRRRTPVGTKVRFFLSEAATVKFTLGRKAKGRRSGRKCVAPKRSNRRKRACTRYKPVAGSFTVKGRSGTNRFTFRGRVARRALARGSYRLTAKATDPSKNASAARLKAFRIVK